VHNSFFFNSRRIRNPPNNNLNVQQLRQKPSLLGTTAQTLRANGFNVIDLVPKSYRLADYEIQIEQQIQRTPRAVIVSFSDSDLSVTVAALKYPSLVSRIIFVESIEEFSANPISDQLLGFAAVTMTRTLPAWVYGPIFSMVGLDRTIVGLMLDGLVISHPTNFDALVAATADGTPIYAYVDVYNYAQTLNWHNALNTLRIRGIPMTAIVGSDSVETKDWAMQNAIPYWTVNNAKHLPQLEQPSAFAQTLIWEARGYLA